MLGFLFSQKRSTQSTAHAGQVQDPWEGCFVGSGIYPFREQLEKIADYLSHQNNFSKLVVRFNQSSRGAEFCTEDGDMVAVVQVPVENGVPYCVVVLSHLSEKSKAFFTTLQWLDFLEKKPLPICFKGFP